MKHQDKTVSFMRHAVRMYIQMRVIQGMIKKY